MSNNCLSVLYKHIIQVENKNVGLKVGGTNIPLPPPPPIKNVCVGGGGGHMPPLPQLLLLLLLLLLLRCSFVNKSRLGLKVNVVYIFS